MTPPRQIVKIMTVGISFPFERDIVICLLQIAVLNHPYTPLDDVKYVERDKQQLALLGRVDALVIHHIAIDPPLVACPERPKEI